MTSKPHPKGQRSPRSDMTMAPTVASPSTSAPKRKKNASKKGKKSWRKNVDLDDVEDFLEDQRLEQRLGGEWKVSSSRGKTMVLRPRNLEHN